LLANSRELDCAIHLEWLISRFLPCWGTDRTRFKIDYVEATIGQVVDELALRGDSQALVVLRGLQAVAEGAIAEAARDAGDDLASRVFMPGWASQIGRAQAVDARVMRNKDDASKGVMVEFAYADGRRHSLAAFIASDLGGAVKFLGLSKPFAESLPGETGFDAIAPSDARALIRDALDATDQVQAIYRGGDPSIAELGPLLWSRVRE
jgi:hypothetical protein